MDTCVVESQKMYLSTPKSICYRKYVIHPEELGEFDITDITLQELQNEISPRISANDLVNLLINEPEKIATIDLRGVHEFNRIHVIQSINIPFTSVLLGDTRLESLNVPNLEAYLNDKIVVIISNVHDNAILVRYMLFRS